jgi:acyl-CoA hydrolase
VAAWIDISAAISAQRFCRRSVVTASIDELHFLHPIQRGHIAIFQAMVNCAWKHSMEVGVRVEGEDPLTGQRTHTASAYLTFVALDEEGRPVPVPALDPQNADEMRRQREGERRRARRLEYKKLRMAEEG